jgi:predicted solute-binding protein
LYIYFQNKEDLIVQLGIEVGLKIHVVTFEGFDYEASFEDGLWMQWKNRAKYVLENPIGCRVYRAIQKFSLQEKTWG